MLKDVFEITGGLPILVWEEEGGACEKNVQEPRVGVKPVIQSELARHGYSQEELYFSNRDKVLRERLKGKEDAARSGH
jgi:hypothetical protein